MPPCHSIGNPFHFSDATLGRPGMCEHVRTKRRSAERRFRRRGEGTDRNSTGVVKVSYNYVIMLYLLVSQMLILRSSAICN